MTTLTEIKKAVIAAGGTYKKEKFYLNCNHAYTVNGETMTFTQLIERFRLGEL